MKTSTANIPTENASKYLQQLCKHFGRRISVQYTATSGSLDFPFGHCDLFADETHIILKPTAKAEDLPRLEEVLASHLSRFAFRENPTITWQTADGGTHKTGEFTC